MTSERMIDRVLPVATVLGIVVLIWYAAAILLNGPQIRERLDNLGAPWSVSDFVATTWSMERPVLPAPHQIAADFYASVFATAIDSKRSLVYHANVTVSATIAGFVLGSLLGVALAAGIVHLPVLDRSLLPWIIASQTVPILAIAPMVVIWLGGQGLPVWMPVAVISAFLTFFPVAINTLRGLDSTDPRKLELMRSYAASEWSTLWRVKFPCALPYLFSAFKVAATASVVGAIIGELPSSIQDGLGGAILNFAQYYSLDPSALWATNIIAALLGILFFSIVAIVERLVVRRAPENVA
jgi:NitT/TauT family transport system permease protein